MRTETYPSDLSDEQWRLIGRRLPDPPGGGRPRATDLRAVVDAILYVVRQGCTWRALPAEFPYWNTAFWYFQEWQTDGTWDRVEDALRPGSHAHLRG